jgi:phage terminase large subunit
MAVQTTEKKRVVVYLPKVIGAGYGAFWRSRSRWIVLKGGRGSKKSKTTSLRFIYNLMKYPGSNLLVIRKHFNTHKDSTFADLKWAAAQLQVSHLWKFTVSPLEATYKPTGQKILFRGLDDPLKITSITVEKGNLCWHWWEEVFEIEDAAEFDTVEETLRGAVPAPLWKETVITYNPWVNQHWTKVRYWDGECPPDTLRLTTTHKCNEFLDDADHAVIEALAVTNPERYKVVGLGEYGVPGGAFFSEFRPDIHVVPYKEPQPDEDVYYSMDYGLDMLAGLWIAVNRQGDVRIFNELNEPGLVITAAKRRIKKVNGDYRPVYWYAPPDLWASNAETGRSQADAFWEDGQGLMLTMSKNAVASGCSALAEWLHPYEYSDPVTGETKLRSRMTICANCTTLINHISQIKADETKPNEYDKEPHYLTHIVDALRYFAVMRTYPPVPPLSKEKRYSFDEDIDEKPSGGLYD